MVSLQTTCNGFSLMAPKYSIGTMIAKDPFLYHVNSSYPILVRLHDYLGSDSYGYIGGYRKINTTDVERLKGALSLHCLADNWLVTIDLFKLVLSQQDISHVHFGGNTCRGTLQDHFLVFNVSYDQCHTVRTITNDKIVF